MSEETLVPERGQLTAWYVCWVFWSVVAAACCVPLLFVPAPEALWVFLGCFVPAVVTSILILAWIPAFFRSLESTITDEQIESKSGVFWQRKVTVPYTKVTNIDITQGPVQRMYNVGTIHVQTAGAGGAPGAIAELRLTGVRDLEQWRDVIMARVKDAAPHTAQALDEPVASPAATMQEMLRELQAIRRLIEDR